MKCEHNSAPCRVTDTMATKQHNGNVEMSSPLTTTMLKGIHNKYNKFLTKWEKIIDGIYVTVYGHYTMLICGFCQKLLSEN